MYVSCTVSCMFRDSSCTGSRMLRVCVVYVSCMFRVSCFASKHARADYLVKTFGFSQAYVSSHRSVVVVGKV